MHALLTPLLWSFNLFLYLYEVFPNMGFYLKKNSSGFYFHK